MLHLKLKYFIIYFFLEIYQNINNDFFFSQIKKEQSDRTRNPDQRSMTERFVRNFKRTKLFFLFLKKYLKYKLINHTFNCISNCE